MRKSTRALVVLLVVVLLVVLAGCSGGGSTGSSGSSDGSSGDSSGGSTGSTGGGTSGTGGGVSSTNIVMSGFAFSPSSLEVAVGDTVTWTNEDSVTHDVEIDGKNLGTVGKNETLTWVAETAGTFDYLCTIHPSMSGEVIVK